MHDMPSIAPFLLFFAVPDKDAAKKSIDKNKPRICFLNGIVRYSLKRKTSFVLFIKSETAVSLFRIRTEKPYVLICRKFTELSVFLYLTKSVLKESQ